MTNVDPGQSQMANFSRQGVKYYQPYQRDWGLVVWETECKFGFSTFTNPFIQINQFDFNGLLGINEWTSTIDFTEDIQFAVAEAVALVNISASTSPSSIRITSPSELASLVNPLTDNNDQIVFEASLEVVFPVFLIYDGIGLGVRVEYM